jgi:hypothetical protein
VGTLLGLVDASGAFAAVDLHGFSDARLGIDNPPARQPVLSTGRATNMSAVEIFPNVSERSMSTPFP